jgi:hypothetical protein
MAGAAFTLTAALLWLASSRAGSRLIEHHRWAVHACHVDAVPQFCLWRRSSTDGPSPVRGVFDGVGLVPAGRDASARVELSLKPGGHRITGELQLRWSRAKPALPPEGQAIVRVNGKSILQLPMARLWAEGAVPLDETFDSAIGRNVIDLAIQNNTVSQPSTASERLWLLGLALRPL